MRVTPLGAAGAVNRPVVPHAPCRGKPEDKEREDRRALEPDKPRGDDARLNL